MSKDEDRLFEELTIIRELESPIMPPWYGVLNELRWRDKSKPMGRLTLYNASSRYKKVKSKDIVYYNKEGRIHRLYGPAFISKNYDMEMWYKDGILHREDGPAIRFKKDKYWIVDGKFHRLDGPAIEEVCGPKQYYINGQKLSPKQYKWEIERRKRKGLINETKSRED